MSRRRYLDWKDCCVTLFNDDDKCMVVFLTDNGHTKAINYDDNFFYVESVLDAYVEMLEKSFMGWNVRQLTDDDYDEMKEFTTRFYRHIKRQCNGDFNLELCKDYTREILGWERE